LRTIAGSAIAHPCRKDSTGNVAEEPKIGEPKNELKYKLSTKKTLPEAAAITVTVLNSTKRKGLAAATRLVLVKDGFRSPGKAVNDDKSFGGHGQIAGVGEIRYGADSAPGAQLLAYYFPGAKLVKTEATDSTVLVSLGAAFKAVATPAAVTAALKGDGITLVRTTGTPEGSSSTSSC